MWRDVFALVFTEARLLCFCEVFFVNLVTVNELIAEQLEVEKWK